MDFADSMAKFKLICLLKMFKGFLVLIALLSMVSFLARLINLQRIIPSPTAANKSSDSGLIGTNSLQSSSSFK